MDQDNIIKLKTAENNVPVGTDVDSNLRKKDNSNGGGGNMNDKYVTHEELEANTAKILRQMDKQFYELNQKIDKNNLELIKQINNLETKTNEKLSKVQLDLNDTKNTTNSNKEKINWLLYTAVGGIVISVITTIISNLVTK